MAPVFSLLAGVLINSGVQGQGPLAHLGYTAGTGDQLVLSPDGMQMAEPSLFANDFFLESAPEPHWFFNLVTALGHSVDQLSVVYFIYWCIGLVFFGLATALLAQRWAPRMPWVAGAAFIFVMSLAPWAVAGTGTPMIAAGIPAVVGGFAAFLTCASLLTRRFALASVAAIVTSVLHVQQGLVVAIILSATLTIRWISQRRPDPWLLTGAIGSATLVAYGLLGNGFGGAIGDFVLVCDEMIPYHCAAHAWGPRTLLSASLAIILALYSLRLVPRDRWLWGSSVGLIVAGLTLGILVDFARVPFLGPLAQGSNIYRLGALLAFFSVWGLISYLLKPVRGRADAAAFLVWLLVAWLYMSSGAWQFRGSTGWAIYVVLLVIAVVAAFGGKVAARFDASRRLDAARVSMAATGAAVAVLLVGAVSGGFLALRPLDAQFIPNDDIREWGESVEAAVPAGATILHAPNATYVKLATKRANIADCKNVPYGGAPYREWKQRIDDLGGWKEQCKFPFSPAPFNDLSASDLERAAEKYGAAYIVLEESQLDVLDDLDKLGWKVRLSPVNDLKNFLLERQ